ncbi:unnamed protein product [Moneuplotes crassus]|uniref:USP domain-containing protein n=1 Tax=Euplotes crassus TaxID=5936 RepID=A0AAD2DAC3_EUPCR|nr:unnamed protein product [Moneuplotes crassus]
MSYLKNYKTTALRDYTRSYRVQYNAGYDRGSTAQSKKNRRGQSKREIGKDLTKNTTEHSKIENKRRNKSEATESKNQENGRYNKRDQTGETQRDEERGRCMEKGNNYSTIRKMTRERRLLSKKSKKQDEPTKKTKYEQETEQYKATIKKYEKRQMSNLNVNVQKHLDKKKTIRENHNPTPKETSQRNNNNKGDNNQTPNPQKPKDLPKPSKTPAPTTQDPPKSDSPPPTTKAPSPSKPTPIPTPHKPSLPLQSPPKQPEISKNPLLRPTAPTYTLPPPKEVKTNPSQAKSAAATKKALQERIAEQKLVNPTPKVENTMPKVPKEEVNRNWQEYVGNGLPGKPPKKNNGPDSDKQKSKEIIPSVGIENPCFDCFLISSIQALFSVNQFFDYFHDARPSIKDKFSERLSEFCINYKKTKDSFIPINRLRSLSSNEFINYEQHDATQYILHLFENIQEEANPGAPFFTSSGYTSAEAAWKAYSKDHDSIIDKLFVGMSQSRFICDGCSEETSVYEEFKTTNLTCDNYYKRKNATHIRELGEEVQWSEMYCKQCEDIRVCQIKKTITHLPENVIMVLQRFDPVTQRKIHDKMKFPLNFTIKQEGNALRTPKYKLKSAIIHRGSLTGGHYTCVANRGDKWKLFNDESVRNIYSSSPEKEIEDAYILMYSRTD